jgi:hypothetical protein
MRYKNTGEIVSFIMTIVGDKEYLEKKEFKLWDNDYTIRDDDFSGLVLYHSLEGKFVNGWRYTNGKVTHKVKIDFDMDVRLQNKRTRNEKRFYFLQNNSRFFTLSQVLLMLFLFSCQNKYKKQATNFIYDNIKYKSFSEKKIINNNGKELTFNPYEYRTLYGAKDTLELLIRNNNLFYFQYPDSEYIQETYIKNHLKLIFKAREKSTFLKHLNFNQFCEYLLPYRIGEEKFVDYDSTIIKRFQNITANLPVQCSIYDAVTTINTELKKQLVFDLRSHAMLYEPNILEVLNAGKGSCNSLTMATTLTMRLFGIPVTIDECPVWAHRNSGHRWNAALDESGKWIPFSGGETNPDEFQIINDSVKAPKIFRYTFSHQDRFQPPGKNQQNTPAIFRKTNRIDVTNQYTVTSDVNLFLNSTAPHDSILYLSVFNAEKWRIVSWATVNNRVATFKNMGANHIVYLPVFYYKGEITPATHPFILSPYGMKYIKPNLQRKREIIIMKYNQFYDFRWNIGIPKLGLEFELFFWNNGWESCGTCSVNANRILNFSDVPINGLFLIKSHNWKNTWQRIFTIENGEQKWY